MSSKIPIRNIYYLLCYAWNTLEEGKLVDISELESNELVDLFATVLHSGITHLLRRGLAQEYETFSDDLNSIRGKIEIPYSARRLLLAHGKAHCSFDELTVNSKANQVLKSTVSNLVTAPILGRRLRHKLSLLRKQLGWIDEIRLTRSTFSRIQLHSNARLYRFLISVCELIHSSVILDESSGDRRFRDFLRDENRMASLYEDFIRNFCKLNRPDLDIRTEQIRWAASSNDTGAMDFLPVMNTDISVRSNFRTLIIDAKYHQETFSGRFKRTVKPSNLYQIFSYIQNLKINQRQPSDQSASGMLLYPVVSDHVRLKYTIAGHDFSVATIDLAQDWQGLHGELMDLLEEYFPSPQSLIETA